MKKAIIAITLLAGTFASCKKVLTIEDYDSYSPEKVWSDENLANAFLTNIYPMFGNWSPGLEQKSDQMAGIFFFPDRVNIVNDEFKSWNYNRIRLLNEAIVEMGKGPLKQEIKDKIIGQALFMRAYAYFDMVVHHGGVPYITVPQDRYADDLYTPRNNTKECFELIIKDIDQAISMLPPKIATSSGDYGRVDGAFALAFKGKVLLYKASPQFNPANPWGNAYWAEAYTANKKAYDDLKALGFKLVEDYSNIALVEKGTEAIFSVVNQYPNKTTEWDNGVRPGSESRGPAYAVPTWDFVKAFPMKDGKKYNDPTGAYYQGNDSAFLQNYWKNRDPRFNKSIVWNGKPYPVSGKTDKRQYTALGVAHELDDYGINPNANLNSTNIDRYTGFFVLKNSLLRLRQAEVQQYDVDYVLMRFAEVMLNYAETANETGHIGEAMDILRQIRQRAGIEPGADGNYGIVATTREQMREAIIDERNIELCFEGQRFWDLRRLRMLDRLNNLKKWGVEAIAINPNRTEMPINEARTKGLANQLTEENFKYSLLQVPRSGVQVMSVPETYYFFPIKKDVLDRNPKLQQNINWGGTFVPTLD
ncbi:RagB/SusD family nutrient uptake outer membrane protein [Chitinophaga pollutisoli]|uniref:RagB/SusD family nutrient uptake outer membrane protein n=1 Tax=Chitinophaga pollutisoli TaxID=3133966 RepID=A0ABZ2YN56_9BACT